MPSSISWRFCLGFFQSNRTFSTALVIIVLIATAVAAEPVPVSSNVAAVEEADRLYDAARYTEMYDYLVRFKDTTDDELLWRLARACRYVGLRSSTSADDKKRLTLESLDFAQRALEANPNNFATHKWYAICLSEVGDYMGSKFKIQNANVIKEHLLQAIELNPKDALSLHWLGLWYFTYADLSWYDRKIAATVFGSPPSATYEEALTMFLAAEKVSPKFYSMNLYMLGKTYEKMGDNNSAVLYLDKLLHFNCKTDEDIEAVKMAEEMLKTARPE